MAFLLTKASSMVFHFLSLASMAAVTIALFISLFASFPSSAEQSSEIQSEIDALTSFKMNLQDPLGALSDWNSSSPFAPCDWRGVVCSDDRVTELLLPRLQLAGPIKDRLSELLMLRKLSLRSNAFNGTVPASLSKCTSLREVFLQYNSLSGSLPPEFANLTNLQALSLAQNMLYGVIPSGLPPNINYLDLSSNAFTGEIPGNISELTHLKLVNFSYNQFDGEIPTSFGQLQNLQYLLLDYNLLEGTLPSAIADCSSLIYLSVEGNLLSGVISSSIGVLPNLQVLSLSHNNLSGSIPSSLFCNSSFSPPSLQVVHLGFNSFTVIAGPEVTACFSVLQVMDLQRNQITGSFPSWLTQISSLTKLDISCNSFSGEISPEIGNLLTLEELILAENLLTGKIPDSFSHMNGLKVLSLGGNSFSGSAPPSIADLLKLETLNLRGNSLTGSFSVEFIELRNLTTLDLSGNKFSGEIPAGINSLNQLISLNLSNSGFSGQIPSSLGNLLKLTTLDLSKQGLSGQLPFELFGLPNLQVIELQENMLSGDLPEGFGSLMGLRHLNLSFNSFTGNISSNYGFLSSLAIISLSGNLITGVLPPQLGNCSDLQVLQLRSNSIAGHIPRELSHLNHLKELDLSLNQFSGEIPEEISDCSDLKILDLSFNNLSGAIPASLSLIPGLVNFNVSSNDLDSEIPVSLGSRFNNPSVFAYNMKLCGKPLNRKCDDKPRKDGKEKLIVLLAMAASGACLLSLCCCFYIYSLLKWRTRLKGMVAGEKRKSPARVSSAAASAGRGSSDSGGPRLEMFNNMITVTETVEATRQFDEENVLSRTRYGLVFKACYNDGMVLSIRRLPDNSIDENVFRKEAELVGKLKHRNITVLRGYYAGPPPDLRLLAYDYMPNGNLATLLQEASHQDGQVLNWPMRHLIAIGIARGLAYLHCSAVVHGDVKPQNVLFDADFEAHLSDFGLSRFTAAVSTSVGSLGYVSPEATMTGEVTKESDIYSFGILLLELLSGKRPVMFSEDEDLVQWVKKQLQMGQITELLEPGLLKLDPESLEWDEFLLGIKVGLLCTAGDPLDRPPMSEVVFMLEGCRIRPEVSSSGDPTSEPDNRV